MPSEQRFPKSGWEKKIRTDIESIKNSMLERLGDDPIIPVLKDILNTMDDMLYAFSQKNIDGD